MHRIAISLCQLATVNCVLRTVNCVLLTATLLLFLFACKQENTDPLPAITSVSPGAAGKCQYVRIEADITGLLASDLQVQFNGTPAEIVSVTDSTLLVRVPDGATTGKITLETPDGSVSTDQDFPILKGVWNRLADFPGEARFAGAGFVLNDKIYYGTGSNNPVYFEDFWEFDPATGNWTQKAPYPGGATYGATGIVIGDKGYLGFGVTTDSVSQLWQYDPATDTWAQMADFPEAWRYGVTGFSLNGKGYFGGGVDTGDFWEYDPATDAWTQLASSPPGNQRFAGIGFALNGFGFAGLGGYGTLNDLHRFDAATGTWASVASLPSEQSVYFFSSAFTLNGMAYVRISDEFWRYDPVADTWTQLAAPCGSPQYVETAFSVGGKGYLINGNGSSSVGAWPSLTIGATKEVWEFTPED